MTDQFSVDLEHLDQTVAQLSALTGFIGEHLDELDRCVAGLHQSSWSGAAATAHAEAHAIWGNAARAYNEGVADMKAAARLAHDAYTSAITANTKMFRGE